MRGRDVGAIVLVWILLTSGTVVPNLQENVRFTLLIGAFLMLLQFIHLLKQARSRRVFGALASYLALLGFAVIPMIVHADFASYLTYARVLTAVGLACGCAVLVEKKVAIRLFVNFISVVALCSLIFFYGNFVGRFPEIFHIEILNETPYYNAYVYVQLAANETRNTAIYIEPGLYQIYLCLGLFMLLYGRQSIRYKYPRIGVLIIALISTNSTAGYIAGLLVMSGLAFNDTSSRFRAPLAILRVLVVLSVIGFSVTSSYFVDNLESKFSGKSQLSWMGRKDSTFADLEIIAKSPFSGAGAGGYMGEIDAFGARGYQIDAATNTYTQLAAVFGLLFPLLVVALQVGTVVAWRENRGLKLVLAAVWAASFLNQPFVLYPFFYLPAFLLFNRWNNPMGRGRELSQEVWNVR